MRILFLSLLGAFVILPVCGWSQTGEAQRARDFAHALTVQGEYYRAITEYKRALFLATPADTAIRADAILGVGGALYAGLEYERAGEWIYGNLDNLSELNRVQDGTVLMSRAFLSAERGERLLHIIDEDRLPAFQSQYYRSLALANVGQWPEAYDAFSAVPQDNPFYSASQSQASVAQEAVNASWKSPRRAGWLGIVPGLGYFYADHKQTAVASLIVNALFFAATYQAFDSDQNVLGGFLAVLSVSWYASNIYGSVQAAKRYNKDLQRDLWEKLEY